MFFSSSGGGTFYSDVRCKESPQSSVTYQSLLSTDKASLYYRSLAIEQVVLTAHAKFVVGSGDVESGYTDGNLTVTIKEAPKGSMSGTVTKKITSSNPCEGTLGQRVLISSGYQSS